MQFIIIRKLFKRLISRAGFTLPEVAAVVAITGTLAAVIVPVAIDQIEKSREARARLDIEGVRAGISAFFSDTGEWPDRTSTTDPNGVIVLRSGRYDANSVSGFSFGGTPTEGNVPDPDVGRATTWGGSGVVVDALVNHLTLDNPGGTTAISNDDYRDAQVNWNGPYMPQMFNDPWGRNYLVYAKAFTQGTDDGTASGNDIYVWIISGGPNETLETDVTSPILNNAPVTDGSTSTVSDDIGTMIFRAREGVEGVS